MRSTAGRPPHPHPDEVEAIAVAVASGAPDVPMKIDKRTAPHDAKFVAFQAVIDLVDIILIIAQPLCTCPLPNIAGHIEATVEAGTFGVVPNGCCIFLIHVEVTTTLVRRFIPPRIDTTIRTAGGFFPFRF